MLDFQAMDYAVLYVGEIFFSHVGKCRQDCRVIAVEPASLSTEFQRTRRTAGVLILATEGAP